jgi:ornithine decarboxylase
VTRLKSVPLSVLDDGTPVSKFIESTIPGREEPFYAVDLGRFLHLYARWKRLLPRVDVFYAMKSNNDPALLSVMAQLGAGFDCASKEEIKTMVDLGVSPERIIYAHPAKPMSHLKFAVESGVHLSTFDSEDELFKVANFDPQAELLVRIRSDDELAYQVLGQKFGASLSEAYRLLDVARKKKLKVIGVSFHIGSLSKNPPAYTRALEMAHKVFEYGKSIGFNFTVLDIGGGFPGHFGSEETFEKIASAINITLQKHFSDEKIGVIAEPGTFFATSPFTVAACVVGRRQLESKSWMYYVNDGIYGTFRVKRNPHGPPKWISSSTTPLTTATVWGPTCCSDDKVIDDVSLPELNIGDWLYFENSGAYSYAVCSEFNGFFRPQSLYYISKSDFAQLQHQVSFNRNWFVTKTHNRNIIA